MSINLPANQRPLHFPASAGAWKETATACLRDCIARYRAVIPELNELGTQLQRADAPDACLALYETCTPLLEQAMWSGEADFHPLLATYQSLFREQEVLLRQHRPTPDDRHHFVLAIPVADRPPHLRACLESIYQVCALYDYGGHASGVWEMIQVVVAEDSRDEANVRRHQALVDEYRQKGLQVVHYGLDEQYDLLHALPPPQRERLGNLLTTQPKERFYLKGQAANRNLCYLKFLQLTQDRDRTLYYLVDSDESLCVNRQTGTGEEIVYALPYFHAIDRIFRSTDTLMLTGKMVGDPPVSPAVMAANFLDDVAAFFARLATLGSADPCTFHGAQGPVAGDAAYHDMAKLFGFDTQPATFPYACRLAGEHDHSACLADFAQRLNAFFFGEHLTRKTQFAYGNGYTQLAPARTVYPGNYIVNYAGLKYVIPFGHLRLRMSGPTAGRLIAAEIGPRFASFNMPNLHRRTTAAGPGDDFRPGVDVGEASVDVSNEFERQFFGDLMLFATEDLVKRADVNQPFARDAIEAALAQKEAELLALYQHKHQAIGEKSRQLRALVFDAGHWWLHAGEHAPAIAHALGQVRTFVDNIDRNFGEHATAWHQIQSAGHRAERRRQIVEALMNYRAERDAWDGLF
ncbi:MAG: hypothetical protein Q8R61_01790 [Thiobacillus sp.]|uniref:hypothetical protein n=1 Tax=Thiobacillus sp. TaxID=924 RepID=UPI0027359ECB|nr:hypothetical protein [Thiobacillus sp.]MDP3583829.1 hypothetical protein [Thiobacillus sp.]